MRSSFVQFDREKLKEAVWLIADHCPEEQLGNVKMHKILYFSDMLFFLQEGRPITGVEYQKQKFGPTARYLSAAVSELEDDGSVVVTEEISYGFYKKVYTSLRPYRAERLSQMERDVIVEVADFVRGKSAREISEFSHNAAWDAAELGEVLPYVSALRLIPEEVMDEDLSWAVETAQRHAASRPD